MQRTRPRRHLNNILQIALKALSREFIVVKCARAKFISESSQSKLNSDSSDEKEDFETKHVRFSPKIYWKD